MSRYNIDKKLPSCDVDMKLIGELADYLCTLGPELRISGDASQYLKVTIAGKSGTETLDSIQEYKKELLPSDTTSVSLRIHRNTSNSIDINFSDSHFSSNIRLSIECDKSREVATGIYSKIMSIICEHTNINHLFHGLKSYIIPSLGLSTAGSVYYDIYSTMYFNGSIRIAPLIATIIFSVYLLLKLLLPYTFFKTTRNDKNLKLIKWVLSGTVGSILFGIFLPKLWHRLF